MVDVTNVLLAGVVGSTAYGLATPESDVDRLAVPRPDLTVLANRGVAGIDGTVSTAVGAALVHGRTGGGPAFALIGDLTLLHDLTGLLLGAGEHRPDLTVVVPDNDGGGIFSFLPQADIVPHARFEQLFGTPTSLDPARVAALYDAAFQDEDEWRTEVPYTG